MRDSRAEAERWLRQAEHDLAFGRVALKERFFVPTRYPSGLAGGVPFEAFGESQAVGALAAAERFVEVARKEVRPA